MFMFEQTTPPSNCRLGSFQELHLLSGTTEQKREEGRARFAKKKQRPFLSGCKSQTDVTERTHFQDSGLFDYRPNLILQKHV